MDLEVMILYSNMLETKWNLAENCFIYSLSLSHIFNGITMA